MRHEYVRKSSLKALNIKTAAEEDENVKEEESTEEGGLGSLTLDDEDEDMPTANQGEEYDLGLPEETDSESGLDEDTQSSPVMLNQLLSDVMTLFVKTLNFHWNIQGLHFNHLHEMLGVQYESLLATADGIAERIRSLGEFPTAFMQGWLEMNKIEESETTELKTKEMLNELIKDYMTIADSIKEYNKVMLEDLDDQGSSDFLLGILFEVDKKIWMLKASVREL